MTLRDKSYEKMAACGAGFQKTNIRFNDFALRCRLMTLIKPYFLGRLYILNILMKCDHQ